MTDISKDAVDAAQAWMRKPDHEDELKPCPFCGGTKLTVCRTDYDGRDAYAVSCRYYECHGSIFTLGYGYFADRAEAIAAWNTRAPLAEALAVPTEAQIAAAVNAVWSELEDSKTQRWTLRKEHIHNAVATALRAIGEGKP